MLLLTYVQLLPLDLLLTLVFCHCNMLVWSSGQFEDSLTCSDFRLSSVLQHISLPALASTTKWRHCWITYIGCKCQAHSVQAVCLDMLMSAPQCLPELLQPVAKLESRQRLRSSSTSQPVVPCTTGCDTLPSVTLLSLSLRHVHGTVCLTHYTNFKKHLKFYSVLH